MTWSSSGRTSTTRPASVCRRLTGSTGSYPGPPPPSTGRSSDQSSTRSSSSVLTRIAPSVFCCLDLLSSLQSQKETIFLGKLLIILINILKTSGLSSPAQEITIVSVFKEDNIKNYSVDNILEASRLICRVIDHRL